MGQGGGYKMHWKKSHYKLRKKAESAGNLSAYIYLIMDAQLNVQNDAFVSTIY